MRPDDLEELPLFPLNAVLFPGAKTQIYVFEPRYRELIDWCLENDSGFGVVLIREGQEAGGPVDPYLVGTVVRLEGVQPFEDGTMNVQIRGERRFRIRRLDESRPYLVGFTEPVVELEVEDTPRTDALVLKVREYVEQYIESFFSRYDMKIARVHMPTDPTLLSFAVANFLQIENLDKQRLLETTDTVERIADMIPILEQHILEATPAELHKLTPEEMADWINPN